MKKICLLASLLLLFPPVCGLVDLTSTHVLPYFKEYTAPTKNWKEARDFCREHHTDLVTIRNEEDNQYFSSGWGYIGLYRDMAEKPWKWSRGNEAARFSLWAPGENQPDEHCAFMDRAVKKWRNIHCSYKLPYMCSDEKLVLVKENKTWEDALNHCRSLEGEDTNDLSSGYQTNSYNLATLTTSSDLASARESTQAATTDEVWTGLRFLAGHWWWVGGEQVQYEGIKTCPTVRHCGVLQKSGNGSFSTRDCTERRNFLCYKKPETL